MTGGKVAFGATQGWQRARRSSAGNAGDSRAAGQPGTQALRQSDSHTAAECADAVVQSSVEYDE